MKADQISKTAAFVAIKFYGLTRTEPYRSLFDDTVLSFYDQLVRSLPAPLSYYHYWLQFGWVRKLYIWSEELLLPGDLLHVVARKWQIQHMTNQLVDEGYEQIIILGAGFDHLGYFFAQEGLSCFELDTPFMAASKRQFLNDCYPDKTHPEILSSHLPADKLETQFSNHPDIDHRKKTVIIAEGFFDYLHPDTVKEILGQIRSYFSHNPALVGTHFALNELSKFHRSIFKNSVRLVGEQLRFNTSVTTFQQMLSDEQFSDCQVYDSHEIRKNISRQTNITLPLLDGFYLFVAK